MYNLPDFLFFFQAEDGIRDLTVTGVQTCALPISRDKILQAAFTRLSSQGYENTSIKEIAEEAGVAQGLVHYYFKSKQQLVLAVLMDVCAKLEIYGPELGEAGALAAFENFKSVLRTRG